MYMYAYTCTLPVMVSGCCLPDALGQEDVKHVVYTSPSPSPEP